MSLCETTSSRVTGRYFSTLSGVSALQSDLRGRCGGAPWEVVLAIRRALARGVERLPLALVERRDGLVVHHDILIVRHGSPKSNESRDLE
jgi:hypothetical protein